MGNPVSVLELEEFSREPERLVKELLKQPYVLFNPWRFAIMLELYFASAVDFSQLKHDLKLTDGGLATHLKFLAREGMVETRREQIGSKARTAFIITKKGIQTLESMLDTLSDIRKEARQVDKVL